MRATSTLSSMAFESVPLSWFRSPGTASPPKDWMRSLLRLKGPKLVAEPFLLKSVPPSCMDCATSSAASSGLAPAFVAALNTSVFQ
ncbi:hypothetical protein D7V93_33150 [Corallococcus llansteffanensis]|uniref:Uncharacterized protein n=1 Tax=Corallococcus llansteffanensis TaxID=2316731 RepID=A0A3A8P562_9BACT|nr:hypothetical protein D7V93_33150 [Corallococcus llansteffanensis]